MSVSDFSKKFYSQIDKKRILTWIKSAFDLLLESYLFITIPVLIGLVLYLILGGLLPYVGGYVAQVIYTILHFGILRVLLFEMEKKEWDLKEYLYYFRYAHLKPFLILVLVGDAIKFFGLHLMQLAGGGILMMLLGVLISLVLLLVVGYVQIFTFLRMEQVKGHTLKFHLEEVTTTLKTHAPTLVGLLLALSLIGLLCLLALGLPFFFIFLPLLVTTEVVVFQSLFRWTP